MINTVKRKNKLTVSLTILNKKAKAFQIFDVEKNRIETKNKTQLFCISPLKYPSYPTLQVIIVIIKVLQ